MANFLRDIHDFFANNRPVLPSVQGLQESVHRTVVEATEARAVLLCQRAGLREIPSPHDFRRALVPLMSRSGVDIFALQKLKGHSDLQVLRRYLTQTDQDIQAAHIRSSPLDGNL